MLHRRTVLGAIVLPVIGGRAFAAPRLAPAAFAPGELEALASIEGDPEDIARDEDFWSNIQRAFTMDRSIINLNNGGVSPAPLIVQEAHKRHIDRANCYPPPVVLWRDQEPAREHVRARLARHWGVDPEEIALTRNASESLQICQFGHDLRRGDEVLTTTQDYPRMLTTFKQRERREGIVLKQFKIPIPCEDPKEIVRLFEQQITARTRLILMSHVINITGQILPVKEVVAMARTKNGAGGVPVIVDGAHALAHFDFKISDLECDFYGVSLHKWLAAPHGTGLLYVRREKIKGLWPLMASEAKNENDIRKYEEIGTHPVAATLAIAEALTFHQAIGGPRKEARLRYLRDRWAKRLVEGGRAKLHTSLNPAFSCGIGNVQIEGLDSVNLSGDLWAKRGILTTAIKHDEFEGVRVTPSVYTTLEEIDRFCEAIESVIANGPPKSEDQK